MALKTVFRATDGINGSELWITDGTPAGTILLKDINPGAPGSSPSGFTSLGDKAVFSASDGVHGRELWVTDGTQGGTVLLKDIVAGNSGSNPSTFFQYGNKALFTADGSSGRELWITDGTENGTTLVKDINPSGDSSVSGFVTFNGVVLFRATDGSNSDQLWRTDGTNAGTYRISDNQPGGFGAGAGIGVLGNTIVFATKLNNTVGSEVYTSLGGANDATLLKDIYSGSLNGDALGSSVFSFSNFTSANGARLLFAANNGGNGAGFSPYVTDGTGSGTFSLSDSVAASGDFYQVGSKAVFSGARFEAGQSFAQSELWVTDGTPGGTTLLKDIMSGSAGSNPGNFFVYGNKVLFTADDGSHGVELWITDGSAGNTVLLKDIASGVDSSSAGGFALFDGKVLFSATDSAGSRELWITDGTSQGTVLLKDINATGAAASSSPVGFATFNAATSANTAPTATNLSAAETYVEDTPRNLIDIVVSDADNDPITAVLTLSNPAAGSLTTTVIGGTTSTFSNGIWSVTGSIANVNAQLAAVTFAPVANFNGSFSVSTSVSDGVAAAVTGSKTFTGTSVADTPSVTGTTTAEDTQSTTGLTITRNAADGSDVGFVKVTGITNGTLYLTDGVTQITDGAFIAFSAANNLKFTPAVDFNGNAGFNVQASTSNSDAGLGGSVVAVPVTVTSVNDAPTTAANTVTGREDTSLVIGRSAFPFSDVDNGDSLKSVTVNVPTAGTLRLDGVLVTGATTVTAAQLDAGKLTFLGAQDQSGANYANITFRVTDQGDLSSAFNPLTINLNAAGSTYLLSSPVVAEGDPGAGGTMTFQVTRNGDTSTRDILFIQYQTGTSNSADLAAAGPSTVTFEIGQTTATFSIALAGDYTIESDETVPVALFRDSGHTVLAASGVGTILNDDATGTVSVAGATVAEGNSGSSTALVTATRTGGNSDFDLVVNVGGGTATAGVDYTSPSTLTFAFRNGAQSVSQTITVIGDNDVEANETIGLSFANMGGAVAGTISGVTITNDDVVGSIAASDVSVTEGDSGSVTGYFTITRTGGFAAGTVSYAIQPSGSAADTTATAGVDYSAPASGTISFAVGQTSALVPFQVLGDTLVERPETFRIQLSNATNGGVIGRSVGVATIIDNDVTPGSQSGTSGNDTLIAQTPGAILVGGAGNDTYLVNSSTDQVIETNGGGADIVYTTVSYNLGVNEVEALSTVYHLDTTPINLIGNFATQTIVGNYGDNVLNGGSGGIDTLIGLFGNDTYAVGDSRTVVVEQAGQGFDTLVTSVSYTLAAGVSIETFTAQDRASTTGLRLVGNEVSQTIAGTAGNDTIMGGGGSDTLLGGAGADTFVIGTVASGNVAVLADFVSGTDRIGLSTTAFAGLGTALDANEFVVGSAAVGTNAQIVYNQATGQLFYDADGTGSGAAVLFAQVVPGTVINTSAFDMIAPAAMAA